MGVNSSKTPEKNHTKRKQTQTWDAVDLFSFAAAMRRSCRYCRVYLKFKFHLFFDFETYLSTKNAMGKYENKYKRM